MVDVAEGSFAELLKRYRAVSGLTQEELAERASLSARAISDLERGIKQRPFPHTVQRLVQALAMTEEDASRFRGAARRSGGARNEGPTSDELVSSAISLPIQPTSFIGRQQEVRDVRRLLSREAVRLLTLSGPGGVGKTRLALKAVEGVGDWFPDGIVFVSLAALVDPELVPGAIATVLGIKEAGGEPILERLIVRLREKRLLLLFDNFEHLLPAADSVSRLLAACPDLDILVTSRAVLHLAAEHEYPVAPLAVPTPRHLPEMELLSRYDAIQLFVQRAEAVTPGFAMTEENAPPIAEICFRLEGLPLAIELAAARIRLFPPGPLLVHLADRLHLLTGGPRDAPARQQTLRNTIDWSYRLLTRTEQDLFAGLSVFAGGCNFDAVETVCDPEGGPDYLDMLGRLVDQNLLRQVGKEELRFSMLEFIREYAIERFEERTDQGIIRSRHAAYFLALAETAEPKLAGPDQADSLDRLEAEHDNLRAALRFLLDSGRPDLALRLATTLAGFWRMRGYGSEGRAWLEEALHASDGGSTAERARGLAACAQLLWELAELELAEARAAEALNLFRELGDQARIASCLKVLGNIAFSRARYTRGQELYEESLVISQELGMETDAATALGNLGLVAHMLGDYKRAAALLQESIERLRPLVNEAHTAYFLACLSRDLRELGELEHSEKTALEALTLGRKVGWHQATCAALWSLGELAFARAEYKEAAALYDEALAELGVLGSVSFAPFLLSRLGEVTIHLGDIRRACAVLREAVELAQTHRAHIFLPSTLEVVAWLLTHVGEPARATRLFGGAAALRREEGWQLSPTEHVRNRERKAVLRAQLGEAVYVSQWRRGRRMSRSDLLDDAMAGVHPPTMHPSEAG